MELETGKYCFWMNECQNPKEHGGYVPSIVIEDDPGHYPMVGDPKKCQAPWVWGDLETARRIAKERNNSMGISDERAREICDSSIRASFRRSPANSTCRSDDGQS